MTLIELSWFLLALMGLIAGASIGAHYAWWWSPVGAVLGLCAGLIMHILLWLTVALVALGPKEFFGRTVPDKKQDH